MGTRHYCDHCGNTIKDHDREAMSFGPVKARDNYDAQLQSIHQHIAIATQHGGGGIVGYSQPARPPILENYPIVRVDLCNTCLPIWYGRVQNITKNSDPE